MRVVMTKRGKQILLTMKEAVLLKRAAWDGPDATEAEERVLTRVLEGIEKAQS